MEVEKPKSIEDFQNVINNKQGTIKRMKQDDKSQKNNNIEQKSKNDYIDYLRNTSENELDKIDMNNPESINNNQNDKKGNLINIDESIKREPKTNKKKIMIKEVNEENIGFDKINLSHNNQNKSQDSNGDVYNKNE
jgi:hypothetical protein